MADKTMGHETSRKTTTFAALALALALAACASPDKVADPEIRAGRVEGPAPAETPPAAAPEPADADEPAGPRPLIATPPADAPPPSVDDLAPYFAEPPLAEALADYLAGDNRRAAAAFAAFAADAPDDPRARPARFMALLSRHDAGDTDGVADALVALADAWPDLADYARFYAASARHLERRFDDAVALGERVDRGSALHARARELVARAHVGAGRPADAVAVLAAARDEGLRSTAWALLAELHTAAGDKARAHDARVELAIRFASSSEGRAAYDALGKRPRLDRDQRFRLGAAVHAAHRHDHAIAVLSKIDKKHPRWCEARYLEGRTRERQKRHDKAWDQYEQALTCAKVRDTYAKATFSGGRNRLTADPAKARELLELHAAEFADRTTVDDALIMLAGLERAEGDDAGADAVLFRILEDHPGGDMVDQAAWDLVWPRVAAGTYAEALAMADRVLAVAPREKEYRAEGRVRYWRGRLLMHLGRDEEARAEWRTVLSEHALSWYAVLAYSRLVAHDVEAAREDLAGVVAASATPPDPLRAIPDALWTDARFRAGLELARLGLAASAQRELAAVRRPRAPASEPEPEPEPGVDADGDGEIDVPADDEALEAADPRDAFLWTRVALFHTAGAWHLGMRLARPQEPRLARTWPRGHHARVWELAHPRPFEGAVTAWAAERDIDPHWIWSIAREESGFNPTIESWANAIGLMQIILPTAKMLVRGTDHEPNRATLQRPEVAIELGSKYLAKLLGQHGTIPLASAGYNAGGGSVNRWRRAFGDVELDEFVERITFREARGYAKRVTRSFARYLWLYRGEMLALPLDPPGPPG